MQSDAKYKLDKYIEKYENNPKEEYKVKIKYYSDLLDQTGGVDQGYFAQSQFKILQSSVRTLKDLMIFANTSQKNREIANNSDVTRDILKKLCPNKKNIETETQIVFSNKYYDILMDCLADFFALKNSIKEVIDMYMNKYMYEAYIKKFTFMNTVIPTGFDLTSWIFENTPINELDTLNNINRSVEFNDDYKIVKIKNDFLIKTNITKYIFPKLPFLTQIGNDFMISCQNLMEADFSNFGNLKIIGNRFLFDCKNLVILKFGKVNQVTKIGTHFLSKNMDLYGLDLNSFINVVEIGSYFLEDCYSLRRVNFNKMTRVNEIDEGFLHNCFNLNVINFRQFQNTQINFNDFLTIHSSPLKSILIAERGMNTEKLSKFGNPISLNHSFVYEDEK